METDATLVVLPVAAPIAAPANAPLAAAPALAPVASGSCSGECAHQGTMRTLKKKAFLAVDVGRLFRSTVSRIAYN